MTAENLTPSASAEEARVPSKDRQPIAYCPYCSEETLFPREGGGWQCHSCLRAFSVSFLGLVSPDGGELS